MSPEQLIPQLVIYMVVLLLAISAHEAAHAWMSYKFGDDTARLLGRVTLNPAAHTDPIGTLLIPIAGFIFGAMGGGRISAHWLGQTHAREPTALAEQRPGQRHGFHRGDSGEPAHRAHRVYDF